MNCLAPFDFWSKQKLIPQMEDVFLSLDYS